MTHYEVRPIPEVPLEEVPPAEFELVKAALLNPNWQYRTIGGICRETAVIPEHVATVLDNGGIARRTVFQTKHNQAVYARQESRKGFREVLAEVRWLLAR